MPRALMFWIFHDLLLPNFDELDLLHEKTSQLSRCKTVVHKM